MGKKGQGRFTKGDPNAAVRSRRWCYDCYLAGPADRQGYTTCKLRPTKVPDTIPDEQRRVLPQELRWPERDHANAHEMVDVVLERDIQQMESWIQLHGDHHFGFEGVAWYWHFVDVVWLGLFVFVYIL